MLPIFYTETCIRDFKKRSHKSFPTTTFGVVVVGIRGQFKSASNEDFFLVFIANGITKEDHDTIGFSKAFHDQYSNAKGAFEGGELVLLCLKTSPQLQCTIDS